MPKNFCETAFECESKDLTHGDCVGNWHCISNRCKWACTQEDSTEDEQEQNDEDETEQEDNVEDKTDTEQDEDSCTNVDCPKKCVEDVLLYNGKCENAQCTYSEIECEHGCENAQCIGDPCLGMACSDACDGATRKYNGNCASGECTYETEVCNRGCSGGECVILPVGTIFTSSTRQTANLGGIAGADGICQSLANNAGLSGIWKALISDSSTNAKDRIPDTTYKRIGGAVIANNKADLFDSSIQNKINLDESSVLHDDIGQGSYVWTGSKPDGTVFTGGYEGVTNVTNCDNWTFEQHEYQNRGVAGYIRATDREWIDAHLSSNVSYCNNEQRLYCVKTSS